MPGSSRSLLRTRWAAVGAAVAVTLGAGGLAFVDAARTDGGPATIPIQPCRLVDTRPDRGIGGRTTPLGPAEAHTVQGTGASGDCNITNDAVGLVLNVTAASATANTNLRLYPTGLPIPTTSNLNPRPGAPPTPNAVTVALSNTHQFDIRNAAGYVHVIIDVNAYLVDHYHYDDTIPSGVTVTGNLGWDSHGSTSTSSNYVAVAFPTRAPVALVDSKVNFAEPGITADGDPQCTGSLLAPTAPAGKVCIYRGNSGGIDVSSIRGEAGFPLTDVGFQVFLRPNGIDNVDQYLFASWAYTAP